MTKSIISLLNTSNYQQYNRVIAKHLKSVNAAIMLSELINRYQYHEDRNELVEFKKHEGIWFYYQIEKCTERTVLSKKEQSSAIAILESHDCFKKASIGIPAKRHFRINHEGIKALIEEAFSNKISRSDKREQLGVTKGNDSKLQKGTANKEPYKELHKENNNHKKEKPSACVVSSHLINLDISESFKKKLSKRFSDEELAKACACLANIEPGSVAAVLQSALNEGWEPPTAKEDLEETNRQFLLNYLHLDGISLGPYKISVSPTLIFFQHSRIDGSLDKSFKITDKGFRSSVKGFFLKNPEYDKNKR